MNKWMPTASAVFLSLSIVPGWAEIKEFNSGDRILAEEMNQNFEYLVQELEKLGSNEVDCDSYDYIGVWVGFSIDEGDPERLVLLVAGAGSVSAYFLQIMSKSDHRRSNSELKTKEVNDY